VNNLTDLGKALVDLNEDQVKTLVEKRMDAGIEPMEIVKECNEGMVEVGRLFEKNEYYISELIMSGEIFSNVMSQLKPLLSDIEEGPSKGTVVIGTVKDDIHDIGKNVVGTLLKGSGFSVVDLGVDVPAEVFVETVRKKNAGVVGLSALLNFTFPKMKEVVDALTAAGLRDKVKVIIGGSPCNEQVREFTGADYYAKDAAGGVRICNEIYG